MRDDASSKPKRPNPSPAQRQVLEFLMRAPYGGMDGRDVKAGLRMNTVYVTLRSCQRAGWVQLLTMGVWPGNGRIPPVYDCQEDGSQEITVPFGHEWSGCFWRLTQEGREMVIGLAAAEALGYRSRGRNG